MTGTLAEQVAQTLEFAGYGPAKAGGDLSLSIECAGVIYRIYLRNDGSVQGQLPYLTYQNPVDPVVQAVLSIIKFFYVKHGKMEFVASTDINKVIFSDQLTVIIWYLWLGDPEKNTCTVLHELRWRDIPRWNYVATIPYGIREDVSFWDRLVTLLEDFKSHGEPPPPLQIELNKAIEFCFSDGDTN